MGIYKYTDYPMHANSERAEPNYGKPLMEAVKGTDKIAYRSFYQVVPILYDYIQDGFIDAHRDEGKGFMVELEMDLEIK